jgi:hypothetical protein
MRQRRDASELSIVIKNKELREENSTNLLGVIIDRNLTWELQIDKICSKISSSLFTIKRLSSIIEQDVLITVYYGLVYPHLKYGITVWGPCPKKIKIKKKKSFYITKKGDQVYYMTEINRLMLGKLYLVKNVNIILIIYIYISETILFVSEMLEYTPTILNPY